MTGHNLSVLHKLPRCTNCDLTKTNVPPYKANCELWQPRLYCLIIRQRQYFWKSIEEYSLTSIKWVKKIDILNLVEIKTISYFFFCLWFLSIENNIFTSQGRSKVAYILPSSDLTCEITPTLLVLLLSKFLWTRLSYIICSGR